MISIYFMMERLVALVLYYYGSIFGKEYPFQLVSGREAMEIQLFKVVRFGRANEFKKVVEELAVQNASDLLLTAVTSESEKDTILHVAAELGHQGLVEAILKTQTLSSLLRVQNARDNTPLHLAAAYGHASVVSSLLKHGQTGPTSVPQDLLRARNKKGNTPLHRSSIGSHKPVIEIMLKTLDPTVLLELLTGVNEFGETPLSSAIFSRSSEVVQAILKAKPDIPFELRGPQNHTLLHLTVLLGDLASMKVILQNRAELAREKDSLGRTPLHYAAALGHHSLVRALLKHDASIAHIPDFTQTLPVHFAAENNDNIHVLVELYKINPYVTDVIDSKHQNILHKAALKGNDKILPYLITVCRWELMASCDEDGNTPLHLAAKNRHYKIVHMFSEHMGFDIHATNEDGQKALDIMSIVHDQTTSSSEHQDQDIRHLENEDLEKAEKALRMHELMKIESLDSFLKAQALDRELDGPEATEGVGQKQKDLATVVMVVATLVAAVAFAGVLQPPGGYISDGPDKGLALLSTTHNRSYSLFVWFVYSAVMCSTWATSCLLLAFWFNEKLFGGFLLTAIFLTSIAVISLAGASNSGFTLITPQRGHDQGDALDNYVPLVLGFVFFVLLTPWVLSKLKFMTDLVSGRSKKNVRREAMFNNRQNIK